MNIGEIAQSPYVVGGAIAVVGLLLLTSRSGSKVQSDGGSVAVALANYDLERERVAGQIQTAMDATKTQRISQYLALISNEDSNRSKVDIARMTAQQGIINANTVMETALVRTSADMMSKIYDTAERSKTAKYVSDNDVQREQIRADASIKVAKTDAKASTNKAIFGSIGSVLSTVAKAVL